MKSDDESAIANFLERGGRVQKVEAAIAVKEPEVITYLASCGLKVKYFPSDMKGYSCNGRRYTLQGLMRLANTHRRTQKLPPFML